MSSSHFDFGEFQELWIEELTSALRTRSFPAGERFYALVLFMFYSEYGSIIYPPMASLGGELDWTRGAGGEEPDRAFGSFRWNPADWSLILYEPTPTMRSAYQQLSSFACGGLDAEAEPGHRRAQRSRQFLVHWENAYSGYADAVAQLCRELTRRAHAREAAFGRLPMTDDFVVVACDPSLGPEGVRLLAASVAEPLRSRVFPGLMNEVGK